MVVVLKWLGNITMVGIETLIGLFNISHNSTNIKSIASSNITTILVVVPILPTRIGRV